MKFGEAMRMAKSNDWIRPRYHAYLAGKRDVAAEQKHVVELLGVPERDRTNSWAASGAGKCLRQRQFSFLGLPGKPPDDHGLNIFANGTWVHLRHQVIGLAAGYLKSAEVPLINDRFNLRGTMDAIDSTGIPVEYKSINSNGYGAVRSFGVKPDHLHQIHSYMFAGDFDAARVVYENKNTNDILEFFVEKDPKIISDIHDDLENLGLATENHHLLPMLEECTRKEGQYRWCPFASQCPTAGRDLSWKEIPVRSATPATSSSGSVSPMSPSPKVSRVTITRS